MGTHKYEQKPRAVSKGKGIKVDSQVGFHVLTFGPNFKSWPKLVRRLESHDYSCQLELIGKALTVTTTAELQDIKKLLGNRKKKTNPKLRLILATPVLLALGALSITLQPENYSTQAEAELIAIDDCGIGYLTNTIVSETPHPKILNRRSSQLGGIETGTFVCGNSTFSYTLDLKEPKRVLSVLELDS